MMMVTQYFDMLKDIGISSKYATLRLCAACLCCRCLCCARLRLSQVPVAAGLTSLQKAKAAKRTLCKAHLSLCGCAGTRLCSFHTRPALCQMWLARSATVSCRLLPSRKTKQFLAISAAIV